VHAESGSTLPAESTQRALLSEQPITANVSAALASSGATTRKEHRFIRYALRRAFQSQIRLVSFHDMLLYAHINRDIHDDLLGAELLHAARRNSLKDNGPNFVRKL
jgi:hypothetical protein